jgi:PAS domain S-box-containing protein
VSIQRDAAGKAIRCIGVWSDLTDVHDKTTALQKALAAQEQLNRELIAHQQKLKTTEEKLEVLNERLVKNMDLLSESEVMLKTSQQIAKTGSWKFNLKTGKCSCSEEFFVIYGLDRDFTLTDPEFFLKVLYGTQIGSEILLSVEKLRTLGVPFDIVSPLTTPLGIQKFIRLVAYPLYTGDTITEIQGVVHDITAFKEAEERLRASEEKFFTVFKFTPDFMSLARESDGVIVEVNNKAQAVSGYSENEMVGKTARELDLWINPGELTDFFSEYSLHHKATCETVWRKKDKQQLIHIMLSSIRVQIGGEYFRLSLAKDITARKETEERLRSSEEKFSKLFRFNPDLMCLARESDRVIVDVNDKAEAITGYTQDETIGKTAKELDLWLNADHFNDLFDLYNRFGQVSQETKWQKKNGQKIDVMVSTVRIEIGGEYYGLTIVKNITASKEAEEKFSKAFNLSPDLMSIIRERDQVIVEVNENGKTMLGYTREETLGKTTIDLDLWVLPEERDRYYQL